MDESRVPEAIVGANRLRATTPTEIHRSSKVKGLNTRPATSSRKNSHAKKISTKERKTDKMKQVKIASN
jgi:hypothetical protein